MVYGELDLGLRLAYPSASTIMTTATMTVTIMLTLVTVMTTKIIMTAPL